MSKRFTDTELYDQDWFLELPPRLKCAWEYLCKRCDTIGIWRIGVRKMSNDIGEAVLLEELTKHFKAIVIDEDRLFLPGFVPFQYGDPLGRLSPTNKYHRNIAEKLRSMGLPLPEFRTVVSKEDSHVGDTHPIDTPSVSHPHPTPPPIPMGQGSGTGSGTGSGSSSSAEGGVGETATDENLVAPSNPRPAQSGIPTEVKAEWEKTLKHYGRGPNWIRDEVPLYQVYQQKEIKSWVRVKNALAGFRKETASKNYSPAAHVNLERLKDKASFAHLEALGETEDSRLATNQGNSDWEAKFLAGGVA